MVNINTAFPSKWLSEPDLGGNPMIMTIDRVEFESIVDNEMKPVAYFREASKGLVLNKTNANTIMDIVGNPETDAWKGWAIELFPFVTEFNGRMVPCIRVRKPTIQQPVTQTVAQPVAQPVGQPIPANHQAPPVPAPNTVTGDPGPQSATDHQQ